MEQDENGRSPTETLIHCLEEFGNVSEPTKVLVIWLDTQGDICWSQSSPNIFSQTLGMLGVVKTLVKKQLKESINGAA